MEGWLDNLISEDYRLDGGSIDLGSARRSGGLVEGSDFGGGPWLGYAWEVGMRRMVWGLAGRLC